MRNSLLDMLSDDNPLKQSNIEVEEDDGYKRDFYYDHFLKKVKKELKRTREIRYPGNELLGVASPSVPGKYSFYVFK